MILNKDTVGLESFVFLLVSPAVDFSFGIIADHLIRFRIHIQVEVLRKKS